VHLITTPSGPPIAYALDMTAFANLDRPSQTLIADKRYRQASVAARVLQRILALTASIWHNETTNRASPARSLTH
jgi:hypothetical protein